MSDSKLEGRNAILEALKSGQTIDKIFLQKGDVSGTLKKIAAIGRENCIVVQEVAKSKLDEISETNNHQGVIALIPVHDYAELSDIINSARQKNEDPFILILDGITDTHNLGAIIRSAEACGCHGVVIPKRRAATLNATVAKASAGAVSHIPVARVTNITSAIAELKKEGLWIACADLDGDVFFNCSFGGAIGIVIGGEGEGVSRLVKENCDFIVKVPMFGQISSLNASVAASLLMYEVVRQRRFV